MTGNNTARSILIRCYDTEPHTCGYLPGFQSTSQVVIPAHEVDTRVYSQLVHHGFRRSGLLVYRPACEVCQQCVSLRIPVNEFKPDRTQKRIWRHHQQLQARVVETQDTQEQYELYLRYQKKRHEGGGMDEDTRAQYQEFLTATRVQTQVIEFREPPDTSAVHLAAAQGGLRMVSVIDVLSDGLSSVYTYYDPDFPKRSYGVMGVLWQIMYAKSLNLPYLYLGYWVKDCTKMSYKTNYKPYELLTAQGWVQAGLDEGGVSNKVMAGEAL